MTTLCSILQLLVVFLYLCIIKLNKFEMKKVGIVTFYNAINNGSLLTGLRNANLFTR